VCSQLGKSLGLSDIPTVVAGSPGCRSKDARRMNRRTASRLKTPIWLARTIRTSHMPENDDSHSERGVECSSMRQFLFLVTIVKNVVREV